MMQHTPHLKTDLSTLKIRRHPRVASLVSCDVFTSSSHVRCRASDISMVGARIAGAGLTMGEELHLQFVLDDETVIRPRAKVTRIDGDSAVVQFVHLEWDDTFKLAQFMSERLP